MAAFWNALGTNANSGDWNPYGSQQQDSIQQWTNYTISAGSVNAISFSVSPVEATPEPKEADEVAWLKRRVREIEWRP